MRKSTTEEFIKKAKKIHGNKYDYSLVEYIGCSNNVIIICPIHGNFSQQPLNHLNGAGCKKCAIDKQKYVAEEFIERARKIHGDKFDYSLVEYKNTKTKVKLICKTCNKIVEQTPDLHLQGYGCKFCYGKERTTEEWINKAKKIHGDKYDYSLVEYKNLKEKVKIICSIHGEFEQLPNNHLSKKYGCPFCNESQGEKEIAKILTEMNIPFERQKKFEDCKNKLPLPFDFYIPSLNLLIEYQGIQHFKPVDFFGGEKSFKEIIFRDKIKLQYCNRNDTPNLLIIEDLTDIKNKIETYIKKRIK